MESLVGLAREGDRERGKEGVKSVFVRAREGSEVYAREIRRLPGRREGRGKRL